VENDIFIKKLEMHLSVSFSHNSLFRNMVGQIHLPVSRENFYYIQ